MTHDEPLGDLVPGDGGAEGASEGEELSGILAEQDDQAQKFAVKFLKKIIRLRGVRIGRDDYLRQELRKLGLDDDTITLALKTTPVQAGVSLA